MILKHGNSTAGTGKKTDELPSKITLITETPRPSHLLLLSGTNEKSSFFFKKKSFFRVQCLLI